MDKAHSYMIGDKLLDTRAGQNYGVFSVLVGTGYGKELHEKCLAEETKVPPYDYYADTLDQAADWILKQDQETAVRERGGAYQEAVYTPGTEDSRSRKER